MRTVRLELALFCILAAACGDPQPPIVTPTPHGDGGGDGDPSDAPDGDATDGAPEPACEDSDGPVIEFLAPEAGEGPNTDPFINDPLITVRCRITAPETSDALPVDPDTVRIRQLNEAGGVIAEGTASQDVAGEYVATFDFTGAENGVVYFRCQAADLSEEPRCNGATQPSIIDLGPNITITMPGDGTTHGDTMTVEFSIEAAPIGDDDSLAELESQTLVAAGVEIPGIVETSDGNFTGVVDFGDAELFPTVLNDTFELRVSATNERGATREEAITFTVDSEGPEIVIPEPIGGEIVGGLTLVRAQVTDPAGIASVSVINSGSTYPMTLAGEGEYHYTLDTAAIPSTVTETLINVTATDNVGNSETTGVTVKLDSVPPMLDLDPPDMRETLENKCSQIFDPVGWDSVNDGQVVGTAAEFRFRTHDLGNSSVGGKGTVTFLSGVDETSGKLLILDDTAVPLIVDSDGDGDCDAINPDVEPGVGAGPNAVQWTFGAVPVGGESYYPAGDMTTHEDPVTAALYDLYCPDTGTGAPEDPVCNSTPLWRIIPQPISGGPPAIYGKTPIILGASATCAGDALDFQTEISEGWACAVAVIDDVLGNRGISPPLRVCFTTDADTGEPCDGPPGTDLIGADDLPECTDGCTPPVRYADFPGMQLLVLD